MYTTYKQGCSRIGERATCVRFEVVRLFVQRARGGGKADRIVPLAFARVSTAFNSRRNPPPGRLRRLDAGGKVAAAGGLDDVNLRILRALHLLQLRALDGVGELLDALLREPHLDALPPPGDAGLGAVRARRGRRRGHVGAGRGGGGGEWNLGGGMGGSRRLAAALSAPAAGSPHLEPPGA